MQAKAPKAKHQGSQPMSETEREELDAFYQPFNQKLFGYLETEQLNW